jgi:hypothetical protein
MAWALFAMLLPLTLAQAQTFPTVPINLSGTSHAEIPAVAVGPSGDINVVWLDSGDSGAILFRRSPAGAGAFSGTMLVTTVNLPSEASQPQIAVNAAGAYVAWAGVNNSSGGDIFVSSLASGANSWTLPVNVSNGKGIASGSSASVPRITVDPNGGVDVVWGQSAAYFARSTDGGKSFATVTQLSSSPMASVSPRMAINSQGTVYVVWENAGSCPAITFARSTDHGATFTDYPVANQLTVNQVQETGCASDAQIALGVNNTIHLLWANDNPIQDLIATYQTDSGTNFPGFDQGSELGFQNLSTTSSFTPQMAIASSGAIDVAWIADFQNNGGPPVVYCSRSTTGGTKGSFSNQLALTTPPASGAKATGFPQIAAEPSGAIDILWQQASAANPNNAYDIVLTRSTDGATFKQFTLDNSPTITGNTGQLAVDGSGAVYAVWTGNSGSSADIFLSGDSMALTNPGFNLTISTASQTVLPGASVSYNVTVNATGGFNQSVTLSCSSPPAGAACSFNPATVTPSTSAATSTLTVSLPATIASGTYSVSVVGTGGGTTRSVSTVFVVSGLTASISPTSAMISVGGSVGFTVSLNSTNGFSGPVTLACAGVPAGVSCSSDPGSVMVPGSAKLIVSVSVKPSASAVHRWPGVPDSPSGPSPIMTAWMWAIAAVIFLATLIASKRNGTGASMHGSRRRGLSGLSYKAVAFARPLALMLLLAAVVAGLVSCGGSTNGGGGGGGSITFPLTIQARSSSTTMNLQTISVTVP